MNDDRGPLTGPPTGPPDIGAHTGPPAEPVVEPAPEAVVPAPAYEPAPQSLAEEPSPPAAMVSVEPVAISPSSLASSEAQSAVAPVVMAALPTVLAIPEAPSDTPVFVMAETASVSVVASHALPAAVYIADIPGGASVMTPIMAPVVVSAAEPSLPPPMAAPPVAATATPAIAPPPPILRPILTVPVPPPATAPPQSHSLWPRRLRRLALILVGLAAGYAVLVLALIVAYRWVDPPRSALMIATHLSGEQVIYSPIPITSISSYLQRAVVTSEDARFCDHHGVDWGALYEAMGESRGGSTITMQTAKNLFLWNSRSYIRKAIEIPVALTIDALWPKRRILEIYLNIAEWGPGIFGAEAAAYYHFNKPASRLSAQEAALLAAALPNPIARDAGEPGRTTSVLASRLRGRMSSSDYFVHCLGLRSLPRADAPAQRPAVKPAARSAPEQRPAAKAEPQSDPWQTKVEPAFNLWKDWGKN